VRSDPQSRALPRDVAILLQPRDDLRHALLDGFLTRLAVHLGSERRLVGVVNAGEALDLPGACLLVEALHVAGFADLDRGVRVHLHEAPDERSCLVAYGAVGGDGRRDRDSTVPRDEIRDEGDPADVDVAIFLREAQTLREVLAHDVAVQDLRPNAAPRELTRDLLRDGALA